MRAVVFSFARLDPNPGLSWPGQPGISVHERDSPPGHKRSGKGMIESMDSFLEGLSKMKGTRKS